MARKKKRIETVNDTIERWLHEIETNPKAQKRVIKEIQAAMKKGSKPTKRK